MNGQQSCVIQVRCAVPANSYPTIHQDTGIQGTGDHGMDHSTLCCPSKQLSYNTSGYRYPGDRGSWHGSQYTVLSQQTVILQYIRIHVSRGQGIMAWITVHCAVPANSYPTIHQDTGIQGTGDHGMDHSTLCCPSKQLSYNTSGYRYPGDRGSWHGSQYTVLSQQTVILQYIRIQVSRGQGIMAWITVHCAVPANSYPTIHQDTGIQGTGDHGMDHSTLCCPSKQLSYNTSGYRCPGDRGSWHGSQYIVLSQQTVILQYIRIQVSRGQGIMAWITVHCAVPANSYPTIHQDTGIQGTGDHGMDHSTLCCPSKQLSYNTSGYRYPGDRGSWHGSQYIVLSQQTVILQYIRIQVSRGQGIMAWITVHCAVPANSYPTIHQDAGVQGTGDHGMDHSALQDAV